MEVVVGSPHIWGLLGAHTLYRLLAYPCLSSHSCLPCPCYANGLWRSNIDLGVTANDLYVLGCLYAGYLGELGRVVRGEWSPLRDMWWLEEEMEVVQNPEIEAESQSRGLM